MPRKAAKVQFSEKQQGILEQISRESTASVRLVHRAITQKLEPS